MNTSNKQTKELLTMNNIGRTTVVKKETAKKQSSLRIGKDKILPSIAFVFSLIVLFAQVFMMLTK